MDEKAADVIKLSNAIRSTKDPEQQKRMVQKLKTMTSRWKNSKDPNRRKMYLSLHGDRPKSRVAKSHVPTGNMVMTPNIIPFSAEWAKRISKGESVLSNQQEVIRRVHRDNQDFVTGLMDMASFKTDSDEILDGMQPTCCKNCWQKVLTTFIYTLQKMHQKSIQTIEQASPQKLPDFAIQSLKKLEQSISILDKALDSNQPKQFWMTLYKKQLKLYTELQNNIAFTQV